MTESSPELQELAVRKIGPFNMIGVITLFQKEVGRFTNVFMQTLIAPMITTLLFYVVFALAFGGEARMIGDVRYMDFLVPGLIMMSMAQNAFANTSSSLLISKIQGNIVDLLMPPLSPFEIMIAFISAGIARGLLVGLACFSVLFIFIPLNNLSPLTMLLFGILGSMMMASLGVLAGLYCEKFDGLAAVTNFIITPLTFLSGTFYSIKSLPQAWQDMIQINPFFFMIDGFRYGMIGHADSNLLNGASILIIMNFGLLIFTYSLLLTGYKVKN